MHGSLSTRVFEKRKAIEKKNISRAKAVLSPIFLYSGIPIFRTSGENANWFEKSGVREIEGGIKLDLIGRVLFDFEYVFKF